MNETAFHSLPDPQGRRTLSIPDTIAVSAAQDQRYCVMIENRLESGKRLFSCG
jgi:hypothetical protein